MSLANVTNTARSAMTYALSKDPAKLSYAITILAQAVESLTREVARLNDEVYTLKRDR